MVAKEEAAPGFALNGLFEASPLYLVQDNRGVAPLLSEKLSAIGIACALVEELPQSAQAVLFLPGINRFPANNGVEQILALNRQLFLAMQPCAAAFFQSETTSNPASGSSRLFITVQDSGADFGLSGSAGNRAYLGGLAAYAKTAAIEWPQATTKAIDLSCQERPPEELAEALFLELLKGGSATEAGLAADGTRWRLLIQEERLPPSQPWFLQREDVVVVSGGARGITAACLQALAQTVPLRFVLLGRTPLVENSPAWQNASSEHELKTHLVEQYASRGKKITPLELKKEEQAILAQREIRHTLESLRATGGEVEYFSVDICDRECLEKILQRVRSTWGPLKAIVHAAGVLADKYIHQKTIAQFQRVFDTKAVGFYNLLQATQEDPLTHICCFSSVSARFGNVGQVDYAMGNEVLNKVCDWEYHRRQGSCLVKSLNWGAWAGGMVTPELQAHFGKQGISLIPLEEGAQFFVEQMQYLSDRVEWVYGDRLDKAESTEKQALFTFTGRVAAERERPSGTTGDEGIAWAIAEEPVVPDGHLVAGRKLTEKVNKAEKHPPSSFTLFLQKETFPLIASHCIHHRPVVPMVLVHGWCLQACKILYPQMPITGSQDLQVLKSLALPRYFDQGEAIRLRCLSPQDASLPIQFYLESLEGTPFYRLSLDGRAPPPPLPEAPSLEITEGQPWQSDIREIYRTTSLFHGKDLRVIHSLGKISQQGGSCSLLLPPSRYPGWMQDLIILDGGLQLVLLWIWEQSHAYSLPMSYERCLLYRPIPHQEELQCRAFCRLVTPYQVQANIYYFNSQNELLVSLEGVQTFMSPTSTLNTS